MTNARSSYVDGVHGVCDPFADEDDDGRDDGEAAPPPRFPAPGADSAPVVLPAAHMTRTEVALRFARHLLTSHTVSGDVDVSLTTRELTRRGQPHFPVVRFLAERACLPNRPDFDWRGRYSMKAVPYGLRLTDESNGPDIVAPLAIGRRLVVFATRGPLVATRSPAEHNALRHTLGRLVTYEGYEDDDIAVALVPRSPRFRVLAAAWRRARFIAAADVFIATVDRTGFVDGLPIGQ